MSSVCESHSAALGAFHGASTGTVAAMSLSFWIVTASSTSDAVLAGGIAPVYLVSVPPR